MTIIISVLSKFIHSHNFSELKTTFYTRTSNISFSFMHKAQNTSNFSLSTFMSFNLFHRLIRLIVSNSNNNYSISTSSKYMFLFLCSIVEIFNYSYRLSVHSKSFYIPYLLSSFSPMMNCFSITP